MTYPRTDSSFLTDDMGDTAAGIITLLCEKLPFMAGVGFTPGIAKVLDSKKVSDLSLIHIFSRNLYQGGLSERRHCA